MLRMLPGLAGVVRRWHAGGRLPEHRRRKDESRDPPLSAQEFLQTPRILREGSRALPGPAPPESVIEPASTSPATAPRLHNHVRAKRGVRLPAVLSREEVAALLRRLRAVEWLMASLL